MTKPLPRLRLAALLCMLATTVFAQGTASQPTTSGPKTDSQPTDKRASKDVDLRKECGVLGDVFRHRTALHFLRNDKEARDAILKTIDPESANSVRSFVEKDERFTELDYHFVEKMRNCEQRILNRLRADRFQGLADFLEAVKEKAYPQSVPFANLVETVELNARWAARSGRLDKDDDTLKDSLKKLASEAVRIEGTSGHSMDEIAKLAWKETKPDDFPASWFDQSSEIVSYEFGVIPEAKDFPQLDLATATREQFLTLPGVDDDMADGFIKYRKRNGIQGPEELRFVEQIPAHMAEPLQSLCSVSRSEVAKRPKKKWTVMVYLNAANNLEPFGIGDMNEMERVGSTSEVNVVVECARFRGKQALKPNSQYLSNPYSDFSGAFYFGLDNSPGTRRYYMLKDDDKVRLRSVLVENIGETDAGRPEPLANFGRWAVENYPAEHYCLVIWNHGAGWAGVSMDENTHHGMDLPEVRSALESITAALDKQGKKKIDIVDFDACLMATVEVAYELRDHADFLVASQETEPGDGIPYTDSLGWLARFPEAPAASFAKALVETYVKSYAPEGSQVGSGDFWSGGETKSVIRLSRVAEVRDAIEAVGKLLQKKNDLLGDVADDLVKESRKYMGRLVDMQDFLTRVSKHEKSDQELKAAVERVTDLIGYPNDGKDKLVNEVVITRRTAGAVVWGFNGWATPPRSLAPFVSGSRYAKTPLTGPDEKGNYTANIKFPPMLRNTKSGKMEFVKEINYRFEDDGEKRTVKDFANTFFTTDFPSDSAVVAEGHNIGNNRSHGISLYFPAYLGFDKNYRRLQFSQDSAWAALCEKFPIKKIEKRAPIALLGLNHVTKADRETFGALAVREALEKKVRAHDWNTTYVSDLGTMKRTADGIRDPRPYGEDWAETLAHYTDGTVILDNHSGGELGGGGADMSEMFAMMMGGGSAPRLPRAVGPEGRQVLRYLQAGGRLLLGTSAATQTVWDTPLYRDALGLEYVRTWNRGYAFKLARPATAKPDTTFEVEPARKGEAVTVFAARDGVEGIEPFALLPDGQMIGAKIARVDSTTRKPYRAVILGFYLTDVKGDDNRRAILKEALEFLTPSAAPAPSLPIAADSRPAPAGEVLIGTKSTGTGGG